uniref:Deoxycytidylate deaminase n=1 Tax=Myoviridae sp. ctj3P51 TaxID=2826687 RepID=A0A8S5NNV0_9CAUD|nr:MAG TPA: deoxycytidylate deaminase [Myoviridae sp. ctj3P51]
MQIFLCFMRPTKTEYYLKIAEAVATRSTCLHQQYGAILVKDDEIIATGYNGSPRGEANCCDCGCYRDKAEKPIDPSAAVHGSKYGLCVAVHAEQNTLLSARRCDMKGSTLYLSSLDPSNIPEPCNICNRMLKNAGVAKIVTKFYERDII